MVKTTTTIDKADRTAAIGVAFQQLAPGEQEQIVAVATGLGRSLRVSRVGQGFNIDAGVELVGRLALYLAEAGAFKKLGGAA